jgi:hypothetical protein
LWVSESQTQWTVSPGAIVSESGSNTVSPPGPTTTSWVSPPPPDSDSFPPPDSLPSPDSLSAWNDVVEAGASSAAAGVPAAVAAAAPAETPLAVLRKSRLFIHVILRIGFA